MKTMVSPSLLSANFIDLKSDVEMINKSEADWLHMDIMDGVFVPNISFGFPVLEAVAKVCTKPLDVHFMIVHPEQYIEQTAKIGAMMMNVHYEACTHLHRTIQQIHAAGMKAGVTLNPSTPVNVLEDIICDVDMVLLMSVNPGFGGQKFIENTIKKVHRLRKLIKESGSHALQPHRCPEGRPHPHPHLRQARGSRRPPHGSRSLLRREGRRPECPARQGKTSG